MKSFSIALVVIAEGEEGGVVICLSPSLLLSGSHRRLTPSSSIIDLSLTSFTIRVSILDVNHSPA